MFKINLPHILMIEPTNACNLKCFFCEYQQQLIGERVYMGITDLCHILYQFPRIKTIVFCGIGEPLLNKDILDMVRIARRYTKYVNLITNGVLLTQNCLKGLIGAGLTHLQISYHSLRPERFMKITGASPEIHALIRKNIINAVELRNKIKSRLHISLNCVLNKENSFDAYDLVKFASNIGIDEVVFVRMTTMFGKLTGIDVERNAYLDNYFPRFIEESLKKLKMRGGIMQNKGMCRQMWDFIMIHSDGEISPCNGIMPQEKIKVGNILKQNIREIWQSRKYRKLRDAVRMNRLLNCRYCEVGKDRARGIGLVNGVCANRLHCKNLEKEGCHPLPKNGEGVIHCGIYERKT